MMELPFTTDQFLEVFKSYNIAIWPTQVVAYVLGGWAVFVAMRKSWRGGRMISLVLGAFWLWMGLLYHIKFFAPINTVAYGFGVLFIIQGLLFLVAGVWQSKFDFQFKTNSKGIVGALLIIYAMVVYPLIGAQLGHGYPQAPMFGVAPCPTTIFTFGILLWSIRRVPWWILLIPGLWSLVGFSAALNLGVIEDTGLLVAAVLAVSMLMIRNNKRREPSSVRSTATNV